MVNYILCSKLYLPVISLAAILVTTADAEKLSSFLGYLQKQQSDKQCHQNTWSNTTISHPFHMIYSLQDVVMTEAVKNHHTERKRKVQ